MSQEPQLTTFVDKSTQKGSIYSLHEINTFAKKFENRGILHDEGGWPKDIDKTDVEQTMRFRQKTEKDERYGLVVGNLARKMETIILQNNAIEIYQQYFATADSTPAFDSYRTISVFKEPMGKHFKTSSLSWSPNAGEKLAVAYFDPSKSLADQNSSSYIWQIENSNQPYQNLKAVTSIVTLEYHPKDVHYLAGGLFNGQVVFFDLRASNEPIEMSSYDESHRDPVYNLLWTTSKTGLEFFTSTTDGYCKWWDARKLNCPLETLILDYVKNEEPNISKAFGATCIEYDPAVQTRFSIGTVEGYILIGNRKGKHASEKFTNRLKAHLGPIYTIQRSPIFIKVFLSIGDWTFRVWSEDCVESPIMWSHYHNTSLIGGCWSPTKHSTFFTIRKDGFLDCWDILQNQKSAFLQIKVSDDSLSVIRPHENGQFLAIGDIQGNTYLIELNDYLSKNQKNDRNLLTSMFECEVKREKILQSRIREIRLKKQTDFDTVNVDSDLISTTNSIPRFDMDEIEKIQQEFNAFLISKEKLIQIQNNDDTDDTDADSDNIDASKSSSLISSTVTQ